MKFTKPCKKNLSNRLHWLDLNILLLQLNSLLTAADDGSPVLYLKNIFVKRLKCKKKFHFQIPLITWWMLIIELFNIHWKILKIFDSFDSFKNHPNQFCPVESTMKSDEGCCFFQKLDFFNRFSFENGWNSLQTCWQFFSLFTSCWMFTDPTKLFSATELIALF